MAAAEARGGTKEDELKKTRRRIAHLMALGGMRASGMGGRGKGAPREQEPSGRCLGAHVDESGESEC